jgi:hypothetical protein
MGLPYGLGLGGREKSFFLGRNDFDFDRRRDAIFQTESVNEGKNIILEIKYRTVPFQLSVA